MKEDLHVKNGISIPSHELEISASRAGGPGGQHVNKTSTKITVRWNLDRSIALDDVLKNRVRAKLTSELTSDGDLIVHSSASRSQDQNKKAALDLLAQKIRQALHVPKKRLKTKLPKGAKEARMKSKKARGELKKSRSKKWDD